MEGASSAGVEPRHTLGREFLGATGPFRAGPPIEAFETLMGEFAGEVDAKRQSELVVEIDTPAYDEAL